jgi:2-polyprenyl-6-methoxyphenol hydroxylase-like FAD-dependent oxidoreductase
VRAPQRPGIVLVGDAYSTSCPAAGTGANKVLTDVQRLCSIYVPGWLGKETIEAADVANFYADPVKAQCESDSLQKALWLRRVSTGTSLGLRSWRGARFVVQSALGRLRGPKPLEVTGKDATDVLREA